MRKRRVIILVAAFAAVVGGLIWWAVATEPPDPVYAGHPLSYWFSPSRLGGSNAMSATTALEPWIDSNAVPRLVQVLKTRDGVTHMVYERVWPLFPSWLKRHAPDPSARWRTRCGVCSLLANMGYQARPAIPELVNLLREDNNLSVRMAAAEALGRIATFDDQPVGETFVTATKDPAPEVRKTAAQILGQMAKGENQPVVDALASATQDTNADVSQTAGLALFRLNPEAAAKIGITNEAAAITLRQTNSAGAVRR